MTRRSPDPIPRPKAPVAGAVPVPTLLAAAAALLVLVATVWLTRWRLQGELHDVLAEREGQAVAALFEGRLAALRAEGQDDPLLAAVEVAALPQMRALRGITFRDASGRVATRLLGDGSPPFETEESTSVASVPETTVRFLPIEGDEPARLRVQVPIRDDSGPGNSGRVLIEMDATGLDSEYRRLDAAMLRQGLWTLAVSGTALVGAFCAAFVGLARSNRLLVERTRLLEATHRELALADRAGALGAVSAHLVHGLRGPLSGIQAFVTALGRGGSAAEDLDEAADATRRMRVLVDEVVRLLREESGLQGFEVPVSELMPMLEPRVSRAAQRRGVRLNWSSAVRRSIGSREAGLVLLILENLVANAATASPDGKPVRVEVSEEPDEGLCFRVMDSGGGLPERVRESLFQPVPPAMPDGGGLGIGLAITRRLAAAIGADLSLESTGPEGTVFRLRLPRGNAVEPEPPTAPERAMPCGSGAAAGSLRR